MSERNFFDLVDVLPEPMTCGRRMQDIGPHNRTEGLDRWQKFKSNGDRVCSYCGSLHFDDFHALVKQAAANEPTALYGEGVEIEPSNKGYKVYVKRNSVSNAHDGGIKFYMQHLPRNPDGSLAVTAEQRAEYAEACRRSSDRFDLWLASEPWGHLALRKHFD